MKIDMSTREWSLLIAAVSERMCKLREDIPAFLAAGEGEWAQKTQHELDDLTALKTRMWNA